MWLYFEKKFPIMLNGRIAFPIHDYIDYDEETAEFDIPVYLLSEGKVEFGRVWGRVFCEPIDRKILPENAEEVWDGSWDYWRLVIDESFPTR